MRVRFLLASLVVLGAVAVPHAQGPVDLSGNWRLNAEASDVGGRKVFQLRGKSEDLDGVRVFSAQGKPLAHIRLPERCANLCFGSPKNNRLYMASSHSLYALYVEAHGAT